MPVGRGGAGNFEAFQREKAQAVEDVEAQRQVEPAREESEAAEYAYTGRGGIGNVYSPRQLEAEGNFAGTEVISETREEVTAIEGRRPSVLSIQQSSIPTVRKVGRGGAGNYEYGASQADDAAAREYEEKARKEIEFAAEQNVNDQLAPPPKARIPNAGVYRG